MKKQVQSYRSSKKISSVICLIAYIVGIAEAVFAAYMLNCENPIVVAGIADVTATIGIFAFSWSFNNSSMYDPYWSVAPIPIALYFLFKGGLDLLSLRKILAVSLVLIWGIRLTYNCYRHWEGLSHEDWRYIDIRNKTGKFYWPSSFLGIHFFPTVMVFLGCLSLYPVLISGDRPFGILDVFALVITAGAILIEAVSDHQLRSFVKSKPKKEEILSSGIWAYSRNPNYFGEIMFWWGLFIFSIAAGGFYWWTMIGPVVMTFLFIFISIPLKEKRMLGRRPAFADRQRKVSILIPWFPNKDA